MYGDKFINFVKTGIDQKYYVGVGNPNSNTLLIGKESAIDKDDNEGMKLYEQNANYWHGLIMQNKSDILEYPVHNEHPLKSSWGKNTWSKYQLLSNHIRKNESKPLYIDFLKHCFTTEMNDAPMKRTGEADKSSLKNRKLLFRNSKFIQDFPVVILACSNYIVNNDETREIDDVFGVTYCGDQDGKHYYNKGNWFYLHYSIDKKKLVIHTRQLSADVSNEMLKDMGNVIRKHLINIGELNNSI
jgi:hypothetical protein